MEKLKSPEQYSATSNFRRDIEEDIREEVLPHIRLFEKLDPKTQKRSEDEAGHMTPLHFFSSLENSWLEHNKFARTIDRFLIKALDWAELKIKEPHLLRAYVLTKKAYAIEERKRALSAGVKLSLDKSIRQSKDRYRLSEDQLRLISTLWEPSFWHVWQRDHVLYTLKQKRGEEVQEFKKELIKKFHADSESVLNKRLQKGMLKKLQDKSIFELEEMHRSLHALEVEMKEGKVRVGYLTIGRPDLQAIQNLLRYDNLIEYIYGINLNGVPDYLLRKGLTNTLIANNVLQKKDSVVLYKLEEIASAMKKLNFSLENTEEPQVFLQTRNTTCGVSSLMMALDYCSVPTKLTKGMEGKLFRELKVKHLPVVPAMNLAWYAKQKGSIETQFLIERGPVDFWDQLRNSDHELFLEQERAYERARKAGVEIQYKEINPKIIKEELNAGKVVIAGIDLMPDVKHAVLVYGTEGDNFLIIDPLEGKKRVQEKSLMEEMHAPFGAWMISMKK